MKLINANTLTPEQRRALAVAAQKAGPTEEVAEQQRIIRELSARYRRLCKGVPQSPPNGGDAA
jgi:hypothetical protein